MGVYRHYKGQLYQVLGLAHDANAEETAHWVKRAGDEEKGPGGIWQAFGERTVVVYIGLQLDAAHLGPRLAVRTLEDFTAWTAVSGKASVAAPANDWEAEMARREGWRPRFDYLGPVLTVDML